MNAAGGNALRRLRKRITYSDPFLQALSGLAMLLIRAYVPFLRIRTVYHPDFLRLDRDRALYGFWHGRLFLLVPVFGPWRVTIMTDLSWAGELMARILRRFGYQVVRGSSKRGGIQGIIQMRKKIAKGSGGALALDGPHGPYRKAKPGILFLSEKLDYPIVPLAFGADRYWLLSTWDRVLIPKPFARCWVGMGRPISPDKVKQGYDIEKLGHAIDAWTAYCDRRAGAQRR